MNIENQFNQEQWDYIKGRIHKAKKEVFDDIKLSINQLGMATVLANIQTSPKVFKIYSEKLDKIITDLEKKHLNTS